MGVLLLNLFNMSSVMLKFINIFYECGMDDIKVTVGKRLQEERERFKYSQSFIGETVGNTTRYTVMNWENGKTTPSAESLILLGTIGFDVVYILTGVRSQPVEGSLSHREATVLDHYRNTDEVGRRAIEQTASALAQSAQKASSKKRA